MLPSRPNKYQPIDESQYVQAETYIPEYSAISNDEIEQDLNSFSNEPIVENLPEYDDRNFPGRSQPSEGTKGLKVIPRLLQLGGVLPMIPPKEGHSLNTLFEIARDLNDVYKRPGKAVWGAVDGIMEAAEKPNRTNAHGVARAVAMLALPADMTIKSAQGFIEGLKGWRGAAEVMHRLGVKNAKEKLSPEAFEKRQREYEEKLKKQGFIGKIASSVAHSMTDEPLEFFGELAEDPFLLKGAIVSGGKAVIGGAKSLM
jgi:hypothetical protein